MFCIEVKPCTVQPGMILPSNSVFVAYWLGNLISNPGVLGSQPLDGFKVDSASYPFAVNQMRSYFFSFR